MILKIEPVPWSYYVLRRRLILDKWLVAKNLKTKKVLDAWCIKNGIAPPETDHVVWGIMKKINKPAVKVEIKIEGIEEFTPEIDKKITESWEKPTKKIRKRKKQE